MCIRVKSVYAKVWLLLIIKRKTDKEFCWMRVALVVAMCCVLVC